MIRTHNHQLAAAMGLRGLTQAELSRQSGVCTATISQLFQNKKRPHRSTLERLAAAVDFPPEDLFPEYFADGKKVRNED